MSDDLKELTKTLIQTQVVKALKDAPEYIEALVGAALNEPVNTGSQYSPRNVPWLQNKVNEMLQHATTEVLREQIAAMFPKIREQVALSLSSADVVDAFTKQIIDATKDDWRINVSFGKEK